MCSSTDEVTSSGAYAEMQANLPEGCKLTTISEVLAAGRAAGAAPKMVIPGKDGQPSDPLVNLMYTSGSSGRPKGAEYHEHLSIAFLKVRHGTGPLACASLKNSVMKLVQTYKHLF